eukprot:1189960-Prorocentrum_minimum.AAC.3
MQAQGWIIQAQGWGLKAHGWSIEAHEWILEAQGWIIVCGTRADRGRPAHHSASGGGYTTAVDRAVSDWTAYWLTGCLT